MKQHHWKNPLLSMLASSAMCAILSFNQPTLRSFESDELAYQSASSKVAQLQVEHEVSQQVKLQLEIALTMELFEEHQELSELRNHQQGVVIKQRAEKQKCNQESVRSVRIKHTMPLVRNTHSI